MYYCFECANKLLARFPFWEFDVDTKVFICSGCKRTFYKTLFLSNINKDIFQ